MPQTKKKKSSAITAQDLYRYRVVFDAQLSPDGRHLVYTITETDPKTEQKFSNLHLFQTGNRRRRQYTYGKKSASHPRWSPDGKQIAFLSNRDDEKQAQIYLLPLDGGEARSLTDVKETIGGFTWSPDGKFLYAAMRKKDKAVLEREADENKKKLGIVARHITTTSFKHDGMGYLPEEKWHLWRINARTGKAKQLTDGRYHEADMALAPNGETLAFISNRSEAPDLTPDRDDIYLLPAAGGEMRKLETPVGPKYFPSFSPDGQTLAYIGNEGEGLWYKNADIWIVPLDGSQPARNLTVPFDLMAINLTSGDMGGDGMCAPVWSADGTELIFQASIKGDTALMAVSVADTPELRRVIECEGTVSHFSFDKNQDKLAYIFSDFYEVTELYLVDLQKERQRAVSRSNSRWLGRKEVGNIEEVWFKARDGYDLHGWIFFPPDFDPQEQYPSIMEIHGGPQVQYGRSYMHEFHYLAAHGYVVYLSNPRGGQGYGERHCRAIYHRWGTVDYDDIIDWANFMREKPYIDPERMGVTGGSYGGYMTNMIIGRDPEYFKAAVTQRSVSNLVSMWGSSDANWQFQQAVGHNKPPYANLETFWHSSPMKYIGNAVTPTLVIHSEQDYRVAQEQGEQVFVALRQKGVETELVLFPGEPHGLSRTGRTDRRITRLEHILRWFDNYLK